MVKEVVWTNKASKTYWEVIGYLSKEFGDTIVSDFVTTVHNKIELISSNPFLFRKSLHKEIFLLLLFING